MARLDNKVAFITGGESGIGLATARLFAAGGGTGSPGRAQRRAAGRGGGRARPGRGGVQRVRHRQARPGRADADGGGGGGGPGHPGPTDAEFQRDIEMTATGAPADVAARVFDARIPLGRHACPEEIARSVLYLACADSSFVTGATLAVNGGMHI